MYIHIQLLIVDISNWYNKDKAQQVIFTGISGHNMLLVHY